MFKNSQYMPEWNRELNARSGWYSIDLVIVSNILIIYLFLINFLVE